MIYKHEAIYKLNPSVVLIRENIAYDSDDNVVSYDETAANTEANMMALRIERNAKLAETDWVVTMHKELGTNIPAAMKTYRQALRDITDGATSLDDVTWPEKP
jgi:uncharacterized protein YccT (UPF0319 family)